MRVFLSVLFLSVISFQGFMRSSFESLYASLEKKNKNIYSRSATHTKPPLEDQIIWHKELEKANKENSNLKQSHTWEKRLYSVTIVTTLIILAGLMHLVFTTHMKKKYYKGLYLQEIKKQEVQNNFHRAETILHSEENIFELTEINPLIVENILHSLEIFEKEKKYLDKNASLSNLAKECGTNTSYMSKVVNHYKKQNFSSYLNDLRLNYAAELWQKHPKLRYKSIQGMADMTGFNTAQSFSKKFNEKYKISPTHFLKKLNQNIKKS